MLEFCVLVLAGLMFYKLVLQRTGTQGWLGLLVFFMMFWSPLATIVAGYTDISRIAHLHDPLEFEPIRHRLIISIAAIAIVSIALRLYGGYKLAFSRTAASPAIAKWCLWLAGPVQVIAYAAVAAPISGGTPMLQIFLTLVIFSSASLICSVLSCSIWTVYLNRSQRVKRTFFPSYQSQMNP